MSRMPGRLRHLATRFLHRTGVAALARAVLASKGRFALLLHGVSARRRPVLPPEAQPGLSRDELRRILAWLQQHGFAFLTPEAFLTQDRPGVLLTFDDGFANNYTNALPVLEAFDAPALFFVTTRHVLDPKDWLPATRQMARRYWTDEADVPDDLAADCYDGLSREQLAACARSPLVTLGAHSVSHPFLSACDPETIRHELAASKLFLEEVGGQPVDLFAYPTGDYDRAVAEAVRACGYRAAFAVDPRRVGLPAYEIPRVGLYAADAAYLSLKLSGLHRRPIRRTPLAASPVETPQ